MRLLDLHMEHDISKVTCNDQALYLTLWHDAIQAMAPFNCCDKYHPFYSVFIAICGSVM